MAHASLNGSRNAFRQSSSTLTEFSAGPGRTVSPGDRAINRAESGHVDPVLPSALAVRFRLVHPDCGAYLLVLDDRIVYIGSSVHVHSRIASHRSLKRKFDVALWYETTHVERLNVEAALIRFFRPEANWNAPVSYRGNDNEILLSLGLPVHDDERENASAWMAEFNRRRKASPRKAAP